MTDSEFHNFLDDVGHMIQPQQFRLSVYQGGVEPSLRKVVWRHLLNAYPDGMNGRERFDYLRHKVSDYYKLRDQWRDLFLNGKDTDEIKYVTNMVKKDVLRTDRTHPFYSGEDDSLSVLSLFNILVTYALTHPEVSYCQGMSDIASPLLLVQNDEAHAYICLCGAMKRLRGNFLYDGKAMMTKFQHLNILLQHYDPPFHAYLKHHNADDMFFCYRWLLLELKREFPLDDALYMLEVMWSSLPPDPPEGGIELADKAYREHGLRFSPCSPTGANHAYLRLRSLTRHSMPSVSHPSAGSDGQAQSQSLQVAAPSDVITPSEEVTKLDPSEFISMEDPTTKRMQRNSTSIDRSLESDTLSPVVSNLKADKAEDTDASALLEECEDLSDKLQSVLDRFSIGVTPCTPTHNGGSSTVPAPIEAPQASEPEARSVPPSPKRPSDIQLHPAYPPQKESGDASAASKPEAPKDYDQSTVETTVQNASLEAEKQPQSAHPSPNALMAASGGSEAVSSCEEAREYPSIDFVKVTTKPPRLPPLQEFGHGNPFLMFLCLTLLLQHRDHIFKNQMDYNDLAMHFDKMLRKHNAFKAVQQAQTMFATYIKGQQMSPESPETGSDDVSV